MGTEIMRDRPVLRAWPLIAAGCLALAALSLLRPSAPTTDPWGWIIWGREVLHLGLDTTVSSPAFKPLPVLITTPLALSGAAAPILWLLVARTAGLVALVLAFRLARRLGGTVAGVAAALFLALSADWVRALEHGYSEPLLVALALGALDRHLEGRRSQALVLGALVALGRPEAFAFLLVYAVSCWRAMPKRRGLVVAVVLVVPALWLGGDWWGAGDPFHAGQVAGRVASRATLGEVLGAVPTLAGPVLLVPAVVAWVRWREQPMVRALALGALSWVALMVGLGQAGYPGSTRFMVLPAAAVCVLAGAGVATMARPPELGTRARAALAVALVAGVALYAPARWDPLPRQVQIAESVARSQHDLRTLVRTEERENDHGCNDALLPVAQDFHAGAVAWELDVPLENVHSALSVRQAQNARRPLVDLTVGRRPVTYALETSPPGAQVFMHHRRGPLDPRVQSGSGLAAHLDAVRGRWAEVDVCRRPGARTASRRTPGTETRD